jgi:hypothetical protein
MKPIIQKLIHWAGLAIKGLDFISPSVDLIARVWIATGVLVVRHD